MPKCEHGRDITIHEPMKGLWRVHTDDLKNRARALIHRFRGDKYAYGDGALGRVGAYANELGGQRALVIANRSAWLKPIVEEVVSSLNESGIELAGDRIAPGSRPNSLLDDVYKMSLYILLYRPDCIVAVGGGSTIDAAKAANVAACLGHDDPELESYYGMGLVGPALARTGARLLPMAAVQTASGSGAHLTKYSNVTDAWAGQKKLIVDEAVTPDRAVFDYSLTRSAPPDVTLDGAFDGLAHCLEVFLGAKGANLGLLQEIAEVGIELIVSGIPAVMADPEARAPREALGLATDLGAYAIMVGGTNGPHLNSFSLVDVTSHGRACAIMNPYYAVFFAPAIEDKLRLVGGIFRRYGYITEDLDALSGRELGIVVAEGMTNLSRKIGFPTRLSELPGFTDEHVSRALGAAKNPQLESKLQNMPVPMVASQVDEYMGPILEAARSGDFSLIVNM